MPKDVNVESSVEIEVVSPAGNDGEEGAEKRGSSEENAEGEAEDSNDQ